MTEPEFRQAFERLTGNIPLCWQERLFHDHFVSGKTCDVIDIPTGLGKTMVMAIWLIARMKQLDTVPTRLIYVVDRRTVVDQATDLAKKLRDNCTHALGCKALAISTLRGQLADNREWSRDPSRPAIIIGTVDLIGSALLFSGYRSSFKRRPLEAGLLGCDSLLVLDEAHLSKPFENLLRSIGRFNQLPENSRLPIKPLRVIRMSATSGNSPGSLPPFTLQFDAHGHLTGEDANDETIVMRFGAKKRLTLTTLGEKEKLADKLANAAIELAENPKVIGKRIAVFVRKPEDVKAIADLMRNHTTETIDETGSKPRKTKRTPYADSVEVLTGTMRGLERDELVDKDVFKERWLNGDLKPVDPANQSPVFLISTSAGEVGFDLNADHLVGNEAPLDSWIQRLGRVNRRGLGEAKVVLVKASNPANKTDFDEACTATSKLLEREIERSEADGMDVSPHALAELKKSLTSEEIEQASSPRTKTAELTDILLDAWSMTSITERMPGRPEVGPWLRGLDDEQARTTIAWRAELELLSHEESPEKALEAIFARHPIRPHESLTVNTRFLIDAFLKKIPNPKDGPSSPMTTRVAIRLPRGQVMCRTLEELAENPGILFADSTLIMPATFGGLNTSTGMLDVDTIRKERKGTDPEPESLDVADRPGYEQNDAARPRLRLVIRKSDGVWTAHPLAGGGPIPDDIKSVLQPSYDTTTPLFTSLKRSNLRVRLVQKIRFDEDGDATESLMLLAPARKNGKSEDQSLTAHVADVEEHARRLADELHLPGTFHEALIFAARWHDEGKKAPIWQHYATANGPMPNGELKGKTSLARSPQTLKGYRHEFGSLLRLLHPDHSDKIDSALPSDESTLDLALHLIATHHGSGRPHFRPTVYDPFTDDERDAIQVESLRRFARLQRKYGWWTLAWLENLLRCADSMASADEDSTQIDELEGTES